MVCLSSFWSTCDCGRGYCFSHWCPFLVETTMLQALSQLAELSNCANLAWFNKFLWVVGLTSVWGDSPSRRECLYGDFMGSSNWRATNAFSFIGSMGRPALCLFLKNLSCSLKLALCLEQVFAFEPLGVLVVRGTSSTCKYTLADVWSLFSFLASWKGRSKDLGKLMGMSGWIENKGVWSNLWLEEDVFLCFVDRVLSGLCPCWVGLHGPCDNQGYSLLQ